MHTSDQDIAKWINGCLAGNRKDQEMLYRHFYGFAMSIAMRFSRDENDAADIMSVAFVKVFKSLHTYDALKGSLHAWIKKIVTNEALDHIKSRGKFSDAFELQEVEVPSIDNAAIERLDTGALMRLIQKLPPATHAVFVMYAIEGYSHREVAQYLSISEGTSKWHLSEARKILKEKIATQNTS